MRVWPESRRRTRPLVRDPLGRRPALQRAAYSGRLTVGIGAAAGTDVGERPLGDIVARGSQDPDALGDLRSFAGGPPSEQLEAQDEDRS